jgi:lysophospholipase L1-like esterase
MSDAIHPNDAGYAKIALRVIPLVKDILGGKY